MFDRRTLLVLGILLAIFFALTMLSFVWRLAPIKIALTFAMLLPLYLFPFLKDTSSCWLWCGPTTVGWVGVFAFWLGATWLAAWGIAWGIGRFRRKETPVK